MNSFIGEDQILEELSAPRLHLQPQSGDIYRRRKIDSAINQLRDDLNSLEMHLMQLKRQKQQEKSLKFRAEQEMHKLEEQSARINLLGYWLEMEILKFSRAVRQVEQSRGAVQQITEKQDKLIASHQYQALSIWDIHCSTMPILVKQQSRFLLTCRSMDLCGSRLIGAAQKNVR